MLQNPYISVIINAIIAILFIIVTSLALASLARLIAKLFKATRIQQENTFAGYLFASPWIVGFLIFVVVPLGFSLYWSFTDFRIASKEPINWIGFDNYIRLLTADSSFRASIINTLYLTFLGLPLEMAVALFLAVMLNQKMKGERIFRMAFYLPVILGFNTAVLLCWRLMLNGGTGIINQIIRAVVNAVPPIGWIQRVLIYVQELFSAFFLGISNQSFTLFNRVLEAGLPAANRVPLWVESPLWSKMSVVLLIVWGCGTMMLIFLAGLNNIPKDYHEAAQVDGAGAWRRFWKISFPLLSPYIFYNLIVGMIAMLQIFEPIFVLYRDNQPLISSAISMVYYLWNSTFRQFEIGYGSAISWLILIIILVVTLIQFWMQKRWVNYDLY
ncbi:MAG: sugar ABC transporter permease [Anaerolineaceae bacterium]|nr:sugar ABC transporter permease [Anaerolineaceae bacterium]